MVKMRKMGYMIQQFAGSKSTAEIAQALGCTIAQTHDLYAGRYFLSFEQMEALAHLLDRDPADFFSVDEDGYSANVVHCRKPFCAEANREKILDFIDAYIDAYNAVNAK